MLCRNSIYIKGTNYFDSISHFARIYDIQTAAMLCCAFGRHCPSLYELSRSSSSSSKSVNQSVCMHLFVACTYVVVPRKDYFLWLSVVPLLAFGRYCFGCRLIFGILSFFPFSPFIFSFFQCVSLYLFTVINTLAVVRKLMAFHKLLKDYGCLFEYLISN